MVLTQPRNKYTENNQLIGNYEKANPFTALCIPGVVSNFQGSQGDSQSSAKVRTQQQTRSNAPCRRTGTRRIDLYRGAGTARLISGENCYIIFSIHCRFQRIYIIIKHLENLRAFKIRRITTT